MQKNYDFIISATLSIDFCNQERITDLIKEGTDIFRILYWSDKKTTEVVKLIKDCSSNLNKNVQILMELPSNKIRLGYLYQNLINITPYEKYELVIGQQSLDKKIIPVNYPGFINLLKIGDELICGDGDVVFKVLSKNDKSAIIISNFSGYIRSKKGICIRGMDSSKLGDLTDLALSALSVAMKLSVDWVSLSFVSNAKSVKEICKIIDSSSYSQIKVMAKIETPDGLKNLNSIIDVADGIMVARGDLAIYDEYAKLAINQKNIIKACNAKGKFCMVSTGMMTSLMNKPIPERADILDVANAYLDGANAIQFCEETAVGANPSHVIKVAKEIIKQCQIVNK